MSCWTVVTTTILVTVLMTLGALHLETTTADDFSGKVSVKVSELLADPQQQPQQQPPPQGQQPPSLAGSNQDSVSSGSSSSEYSVVNVRVLGETMDAITLQKLKPTGRFVNPNKLRHLLGPHFDESWMAMQVPPSHGRFARNPSVEFEPNLVALAGKLNFTFTDSSGATLQLQPDLLKHVRSWLLQQASCPMDFIWEDLGPLFWPRWIRRGVCLNTHSCSWPPGMICRASGTKEIKLLRWSCAADPGGRMKRETEDALERMRRKEERRRRKRKLRAIRWSSRQAADEPLSSRHSPPQPPIGVLPNSTQANSNQLLDENSREKRRARRIAQKLSMSADGYFCQWQDHKYVISDQCSCSCS